MPIFHITIDPDPLVRLTFSLATESDAEELAALRVSAASDLTTRFGEGHWSGHTTARGVLYGMRQSSVWIARRRQVIVGTFRLAMKRPWAIDRMHFSKVARPLYLTDMVVRPDVQRMGVGRRCLEQAVDRARDWPADAIFLDAYDAEAGAGAFYAKCGFREVARVAYKGTPLVYYERLLLDVLLA
jgi:GNAT superfamily N-acetyltransferase